MTPRKLCEGIGMACCYSCERNAENHPGAAADPAFAPAAEPPRWCMDWFPRPVVRPEPKP